MDASALRADEGRGYAAIRLGEPLAGCDPDISEWGNPRAFRADQHCWREPGELKHLSSQRK